MGKLDSADEFLKYISNPMSRTSIDLMYTSNHIRFERADVYKDFIVSIYDLIFETYMGDDVMKTKEDFQSHFSWCWEKTVSNFEIEGIKFGYVKRLYNYLFEFILGVFYSSDKKNIDKKICEDVIKMWVYTFNYHIVKTNSDIDSFIEVYKMFDESLKKGKKS